MYGVVVILQYNDNDFVVVQIFSIIASNIGASNNMSLSGWRGHNFGAQVQVQLSLSLAIALSLRRSFYLQLSSVWELEIHKFVTFRCREHEMPVQRRKMES